jgi:hypothetical protein
VFVANDTLIVPPWNGWLWNHPMEASAVCGSS